MDNMLIGVFFLVVFVVVVLVKTGMSMDCSLRLRL